MTVATTNESESIIRIWTALAAVSFGIFAIILDGSMMIPAASSSVVLNYEGSQRSTAFGIFSAS